VVFVSVIYLIESIPILALLNFVRLIEGDVPCLC
jgi:hypothetical protein